MGLAGLLLFYLAPFAEAYLESDAFVWKSKLEQRPVRRGAMHLKLLALGDSQMMSAFQPGDWTGSAYANLGLPSAQPELFSRLAQEHKAPIVVVNWSPYMILKSPVYNTYLRLRDQQLFARRPQFILDEKNPFSLLSGLIQFFPAGAYRPLLRNCLLSAASCHLYLSNKEKNRFIQSELESQGGRWIWQNYSATKSCYAPVARPQAPILLRPDTRPKALAAWQDFFRASRHKFKLVVVMIPFSPAWKESGGEALLRSSTEILTDLLGQTEFSHVQLWQDHKEEYLAGDFQDLTHLNHCGSARFSDWLRKQLRQRAD
jgi:hypothetical protein